MNQKIAINDVELEIEVIKNLLNQDKKVEAIKFVHEKTKIRLREAKDLVDRIEMGDVEIVDPSVAKTKNHYSNSVFNEPRKKGYRVYVVIGIVLALMGCYFLMWKK
jgi:hypothetical protein